MRRLWTILVLVLLVGGNAEVASAGRPHFVGSPSCTVTGDQLCCSGKIAGLGTAPTTVEVDAPFNCTNRGEHQPGGLASGQSAPITPRGGQITFNVCTQGATCPDQMAETFGPTVTFNVFQRGNLVFSATIPVN
jgi:hypothetical protein